MIRIYKSISEASEKSSRGSSAVIYFTRPRPRPRPAMVYEPNFGSRILMSTKNLLEDPSGSKVHSPELKMKRNEFSFQSPPSIYSTPLINIHWWSETHRWWKNLWLNSLTIGSVSKYGSHLIEHVPFAR